MRSDPQNPTGRSTGMPLRTKVLLVIILVMGGLLGWEYRIQSLHQDSLARLESELERRKNLQLPLTRDEVNSLLAGTPQKQSKSNTGDRSDINLDYYTWHGLIHHLQIRVESNLSGEVVKVEESLFAETDFQEQDERPTVQVPVTSQEAVLASLRQAEEMLRRPDASVWLNREGLTPPGFELAMRGVFDGLPELKVSAVKGELNWNSIKIPRNGRRLFAFRFTIPHSEPAALDYVRSAYAQHSQVISRNERYVESQYSEDLLEGRRFDLEQSVDIEGFERLDSAGFGSRSLKGHWPDQDFIVWFDTGDDDPRSDFEFKSVMFVSKADEAPTRRGLHEICDFIGLRTNVPKFAATPDGARDAMMGFDERLQNNSVGPATCGRIFRPVIPALPEVTVNVTPGNAHWQKLEFPNGPCTAVRIHIPESIGGKADLYGAFLGTQPGRLGWDCSDRHEGNIESRTVLDAQLESPLPQPPNRLTLISHTQGVLESGQDVVLWFQQNPREEPRGPLFVALTAIPHIPLRQKINAQQPWSCGRIAGVNVPNPAAPDGCTVLGIHERKVIFLSFTPDSRRLVNINGHGVINIWDTETRQFEGEIILPPGGGLLSDMVCLSPDSKMLLLFDAAKRSFLRWSLDSRQPAAALDGLTEKNDRLEAAAFGSQPHQLLFALSHSSGQLNPTIRFATLDLNTSQTLAHSKSVRGETASIMFIPTTNMFAIGATLLFNELENVNSRRIRSTVQIYSAELTNRVQQFSLSDDVVQFSAQEMIPVRLSYHPGGRRLAAICESGVLKVWDIGTGTELLSKRLKYEPDWAHGYTAGAQTPNLHVSLSADGETVAAASPTNPAVSVWNVSDGQHRHAWQADDVPVTHVVHSSDGKWVATANTDGVIRLWKNVP